MASSIAWDPDAKPGPLSAGFRTVPEIVEDISLPVKGEIPLYVDGRLFRNGPGVYEVTHKNGETTHINHWFDGIATVHRFRIDGAAGTVFYKNRRTQPEVIAAAEEAPSKAAYKTFVFGDQDPCRGLLGNLFQMWRPYSKPPGAKKAPFNVSVILERVPGTGKLVARSDTNVGAAVLDIDSLEKKSDFTFAKLNPTLGKSASGAHGVTDPDTGEYFNYCYEYGKPPAEYSVFAQAPGGKNRVLAKIRDDPCYLHSITATKNYVILIMYSCVINTFKLLLGSAYANALEFRPEKRTKFYVISRSEEKLAAVYDSDSFFCFHNINAFDDDSGNLQLDLLRYDNCDVISETYRTAVVHGKLSSKAVPTRFTLRDVDGAAAEFAANCTAIRPAEQRTLVDEDMELPRVSPLYEMREDYRYSYGVSTRAGGTAFDSLVKIDIVSGESMVWSAPGVGCGEPIFVPKPGSDVEDEGVLLSVVLDTAEERSFLVVLDARDMTEMARALVPQPVPFGFHGQYMDEEFATGPEI